MRQELKNLKKLATVLRHTLATTERQVARLHDQIDQVETKQVELIAGCKRGDVVRYTSGQFFFQPNQYCHPGDYLEVVVLGKTTTQSVRYHLRLLEEVNTYPMDSSHQEVCFDGDPKMFWRHFTKTSGHPKKSAKET
jgi:hypothetical protein